MQLKVAFLLSSSYLIGVLEIKDLNKGINHARIN